MTTERWLPVPGHTGYEVSDQGRVRSFRQANSPGKVLSPSIGHKGHLSVSLFPQRKQRLIHQLVLEAFVGSRPAGAWGLHKDDDPSNNCLENLYWGTPKQNQDDALSNHGGVRWPNQNAKKTECQFGHQLTLRSNGRRYCKQCNNEASKRSKPGDCLTPEQITAIRADTRSLRVIAAEYGVSHTTIRRVKV